MSKRNPTPQHAADGPSSREAAELEALVLGARIELAAKSVRKR